MANSYRPKFKGTATTPTFYKDRQSVQSASNSDSDAVGSLALASLFAVAIGVAFIYFKRNEQQVTTQPQAVVVPDYTADIPQVQNMIGTTHALITQNDLGAN